MKRWIAVFAVFAVAVIVAACFALFPLAPLGPPPLQSGLETLDRIAARAVASWGRDAAVVAPLLAAVLLALPIALFGRKPAEPDDDAAGAAADDVGGPAAAIAASAGTVLKGRRRRPLHPDPELVWRPEPDPVSPDMDHVPGLGESAREAGAEAGTGAGECTGLAVAALPSTAAFSAALPGGPRPKAMTPVLAAPVLLARIARTRECDEHAWFGHASWLGGLPRLGDRPWPRNAHGPLAFVAQIDLSALAAAAPGNPLPPDGALAFFLDGASCSGAVVEVPAGDHAFTLPPDDLPPAFDEGGLPFPFRGSRLSRPCFPFWPVEPLGADLRGETRAADAENDDARHAAGRLPDRAETVCLPARVAMRSNPFAAREPVTRLWWHSAMHLADRLRAALDAGESDLPEMDRERAELARMAEALDGFTADREPWAALGPDEMAVIEEVLVQVHQDCPNLVRHRAPESLGELATISLRAMITGEPEALARMPEQDLAWINAGHLLAIGHPHQIFGAFPPGAPEMAGDEGEVLLLQLGRDDMMEWNWPEAGVFAFRIAADDLAAGRWDRARLEFAPA